jgi:hypothetical protein
VCPCRHSCICIFHLTCNFEVVSINASPRELVVYLSSIVPRSGVANALRSSTHCEVVSKCVEDGNKGPPPHALPYQSRYTGAVFYTGDMLSARSMPHDQWRRCTWRNERSTWPVLTRAYRAVLVVLTSGPNQRLVKVTALQFDPPSQHALALLAARFPGAPPSGGRNDEPHAGGRAILNSEALRLEIRSDSSVLLELQRRGRHLVMSTSCPCRSRPRFS